MISVGETVETVAFVEVLAAYNWPEDHPRGAHVARFVEAFIGSIETFKGGGFHERWEEVELDEDVPGWDRLPVAERLIQIADTD